ncbi:MAG: tetratricopeptide repeat protein [Phycisphaeraceae bacterium]|nr:tetratricopeptide repeat protein [Phycisphaeraceae bacterium]
MSAHDQIRQHLYRGEFAAARPLLERAARASNDPQLLITLANVLRALGEKEPAAYQASRALASALHTPSEPQVRIVAAELIQECGKPDEAARHFRDGIARFPQAPNFRSGLINALRAAGKSGEAGDEAVSALMLFPNDLLLLLVGAGALGESLRQSAARDALLRAIQLAPFDHRVLIPAATMLHYCDGVEPNALTDIHRRAGIALVQSVGASDWKPPSRDPGAALRIALVSSDFRDHAVARFLEPWLVNRERSGSVLIGVSLLGPPDSTTARLKSLCDEWVDAAGKPDEEITRLIRTARADIAIDLSGLHVTGRPSVFARRVAPIQMTYLGYAGTTGIPSMDCRIVDGITDPPGAESLSTEKLIRLDGCFLCFSPDARTPEIRSTAKPGEVVFCSFNAQQKITDTTLDLWSGVLRAVPHARLLLKSRTLADKRTREILNAAFASRGIDPGRIEVAPHSPDYRAHLETYNRADIALDTFPYNGTTTTCEALSMGLPVVTLAGHSHASRVGSSLLNAAGLRANIAAMPAEFVQFAADLASGCAQLDSAARTRVKQTQRRSFISSALCGAPAFAHRISGAIAVRARHRIDAPRAAM